jgi:hypothetical protein
MEAFLAALKGPDDLVANEERTLGFASALRRELSLIEAYTASRDGQPEERWDTCFMKAPNAHTSHLAVLDDAILPQFLLRSTLAALHKSVARFSSLIVSEANKQGELVSSYCPAWQGHEESIMENKTVLTALIRNPNYINLKTAVKSIKTWTGFMKKLAKARTMNFSELRELKEKASFGAETLCLTFCVWKICHELVEVRNLVVRQDKIKNLRASLNERKFVLSDHLEEVFTKMHADVSYPAVNFWVSADATTVAVLTAPPAAVPALGLALAPVAAETGDPAIVDDATATFASLLDVAFSGVAAPKPAKDGALTTEDVSNGTVDPGLAEVGAVSDGTPAVAVAVEAPTTKAASDDAKAADTEPAGALSGATKVEAGDVAASPVPPTAEAVSSDAPAAAAASSGATEVQPSTEDQPSTKDQPSTQDQPSTKTVATAASVVTEAKPSPEAVATAASVATEAIATEAVATAASVATEAKPSTKAVATAAPVATEPKPEAKPSTAAVANEAKPSTEAVSGKPSTEAVATASGGVKTRARLVAVDSEAVSAKRARKDTIINAADVPAQPSTMSKKRQRAGA